MSEMEFYVLDVFAEKKYAGNQLAVVSDGGRLSTEEMQAIASEMNYSETTFVVSDEPRDGGYDVRIFTPGEELPFAGHPTLGTAHLLRRKLAEESGGKAADRIVLNLGVGPVAVTFEADEGAGETAWLHPQPATFAAGHGFDPVAGLLGLSPEDLDSRFPVEEVGIGIDILLVPLVGLDAVKRTSLDLGRWRGRAQAGLETVGVLVFSPETYDPANDLNARMFFDARGLREDPATGSANACLANYLVKHRYFGGTDVDVRVEQGHEIDRPSLLFLRGCEAGGEIQVSVGGHVIVTAKGVLV